MNDAMGADESLSGSSVPFADGLLRSHTSARPYPFIVFIPESVGWTAPGGRDECCARELYDSRATC